MRDVALPAFRFLLLGLVVYLIHDQHARFKIEATQRPDDARILDVARRYLADAAELSANDTNQATRFVRTEFGRRLGFVLRTSPESDFIVGYSGPNDLLVVFNDQHRVVGIEILESGDTPDYVKRVRNDERFLSSFKGMTWDMLRNLNDVEGISGATLTSLAMTEAVVHRIRGSGPSLRFPEAITVEETRKLIPNAATLRTMVARPYVLEVWDATGNPLGWVARTSPYSDNVIGYQGPTDVLVASQFGGNILGFRIRRSYETREYVDNVLADDGFMKLFDHLTLRDLVMTNFNAEGVEGVSGATMTSQAIAHAVKAAAGPWNETCPPLEPPSSFSARDFGTIAILVMAVGLAFTECRGKRWLRRGFQVVLIVYLGLINGDLLSQALWMGWAKNGIPWRLAPGLALLTVAALLVPLGTRHQLYCHHICPHGAAQQLVKGILPGRFRFSQRWLGLLKPLPVLLLGVVLVTVMRHGSLDLASLEPFDAYAFQVAGTATVLIAVAGLVAALFVPMAYCRYGCPTGAVLNFLWAGGRPGAITRRDGAAVALVLLTVGLRLWG